MPNLQYTLDVILNAAGAKKNISEIEAEIEKLKKLGETGIRVELDKDGKITRVISQLKNETGAVVNYVRQWNEQTKQLEQTSANVSINFKKAADAEAAAAEKAAKATERRIQFLDAYMRTRDMVAKQEAAAAKEEERANNKMIAAMLQAQMQKKQSVEEEYEENRRLLEQEHELEVASIRRWDAQQRQAEQQANTNRQAIQDYQQLILFAQIFEREVERYVSENTIWDTVPIQQYIDSLTGVSRAQSEINHRTSVFAQMSGDAYLEYAERNGLVLTEQERAINGFDRLAASANSAGGQFTALNYILHRLAYTLLSTVVRGFREALAEMKNVDSELVVVRKVSDATTAELQALKERAYDVGSAYGVLASDYLNAAAQMTRAGYREEAGDLAELATKLQLVGDVSQDVANQFLIATDKSYKMNGNYQKLSETIDKLNEIDNNFATSFEKVADGIGLLAPVAAQANVSFDEMAAAIGTVTAVTQRSGTEAARALRSLFINILKDTTTEIDEGVTWTVDEINSLSDALKKYAPEVVKAAEATGDLINPMEALGALAQSYKDGLLTNQELFEITSGLGGKLRTSQLLALIQNWDMYNQMLDKTADAAGSADKEVSNALDSWQVKLNQLKNTFTEFVQKSLSTNTIKGLLDAIRWLIEGFDSLGTVVGIFGTALVALKFTSIIAQFSKLSQIITAVGGGFRGWFLTLTNYKTLSAAASKGTVAFNGALERTSMSASIAKAAIAALVVIISILTVAINKARQAEEERRSKQIDAARTAAQEAREIKKLKDNYDSLRKSFEDGTAKREDYETAQKAIIDKLKDEGFWAGDTADKYNNLTEAIESQTKAAIEARKTDIITNLHGAETKGISAVKSHEWYNLWNTYASDAVVNALKYFEIDFDWLRNGYYANVPEHDKTSIPFEKIFGSDEETQAERLVQLYYELIEKRDELISKGEKGTDRLNAITDAITDLSGIKEYIDLVYELFDLLDDNEIEDYAQRGGLWAFLVGRYRGAEAGTDVVNLQADETAKSIKGLSDELTKATAALDKYKKALEGGEKGDALKSYSEAYKKAVELYEKGLTGSNQYMSAVDLLFGEVDDYEEAGKLLGNAFVKAMFEGGGDDYGANAANYIKKHIDEFEGVQITEGENGTFGLMVTDMDKFAESTGLTADALWTLIDALDIFDSKTTYTRDQLFNFMGLEDDGREKFVNLTALINDLAGQGKSAREIKGIVDAIKELAETDGNITISEPENLDQTIGDIVELNKEAEKDKDMEVVLTSNSDEFFDGIKKEIDQINGTTIYIGIRTKNSAWGRNEGLGSNAVGTKSARGGLSLVNEEGAELIYANGKAWIAGGGDPTITNLPAGAGVFTAKETREILTRSGIESHRGTYVGGIPINDIIASGGSGKAGKGKLTEDLLQQIADYINDILKKAKEALQEQLDAIDEQIDKLKREHDAEEDANKLEELRLKILEAEKKLAEAENERTVRYFNKETGQWEWMADQKAVADAQKALKDAQEAYDKEVAEQAYQAQLQALQDQKDSLNEAYEQLSDNWDKIYEELQDILNGKGAVDIGKLIQQLLGTKGGSYAPDIQALLEAIGAFTANPTSVLDAATTARIMSLNGTGGATSVLSAVLGSGSYDLNGRGQSTLGGNTSIVGDTIYYINGVQIGSDMMDKPLSQILSVLPIYAN